MTQAMLMQRPEALTFKRGPALWVFSLATVLLITAINTA